MDFLTCLFVSVCRCMIWADESNCNCRTARRASGLGLGSARPFEADLFSSRGTRWNILAAITVAGTLRTISMIPHAARSHNVIMVRASSHRVRPPALVPSFWTLLSFPSLSVSLFFSHFFSLPLLFPPFLCLPPFSRRFLPSLDPHFPSVSFYRSPL